MHQRPLIQALVFSALLPIAVTGPRLATAQDRPTEPPHPGPPPAITTEPLPDRFDPAALGLEAEPLSAESLGLRIHLPLGTQVVTERRDGSLNLLLQDGQDTPTWSMRIHLMGSSLATPTAAGQVADRLARLERAKTPHRILSNDAISFRGAEGQLCYLRQTAPDDQEYVTSWLIMPTDPGRFLVLTLLTLPEHLSRIRGTWESSYGTMEIRSEQQLVIERQRRLEAGRAYLAGIDERRLRELTGVDQWYRLYRNDTRTGQPVEMGYTRVEVREGKKGELNPARRPRDFDISEHEVGLLVSFHGRAVIDASADHYFDWASVYWVDWNRQAESWSVRSNERRSRSEQADAETGVRAAPAAGEPAPRLVVIRSTLESRKRVPYEWAVPDIYVSHGLAHVLGQLRPAAMVDGSATISFYTYDGTAAEPAVTLRTDQWLDAPDGGWQHTRHMGSDASYALSTYDASGRLLRIEQKNGRIQEPITLDRLRQIWQRAGLRLGTSR